MKENAFSKILRDDLVTRVLENSKRRPHVELIRDSFNSGKKSYDFYMVTHKRFYAIELKSLKGQSITLSCVSQHQITSLLEAKDASPKTSISLVVILLNDYLEGKRAMVIDIGTWQKIIKENTDKKSLKIEEIINRYNVGIMLRIKNDNNKLTWDCYNEIVKFKKGDLKR